MAETSLSPERPRERCLLKGADCLSLRECLELVLGSGTRKHGSHRIAGRILEKAGTGMSQVELERAFFLAMELTPGAHLSGVPGLGPAQRARLLATFELARRYAAFKQRRPPLPRQRALSDLAREALEKIGPHPRMAPQEWLGFVPVHRPGQIGELVIVEKGARTHVNVEPAELFARVLALRPQGFFLVHNHPSGDLTPSASDLDLTEKVGRLARLLEILLLGHWIVTAASEKWIPVGGVL